MKVAIPSLGEELKDGIDPAFGRCKFFIIAEIDGEKIGKFEALENTAAAQMGGAGITASELVGNSGAEAVIAENVGPRAFSVLGELGIEIYISVPGSVEDNLKAFGEGKLEKLEGPSGPMGQGMR